MDRSKAHLWTFLSVVAFAASCGGDAGLSSSGSAEAASDLSLGARGEEVRALHGYLTRFGYFPNAELARTYPAWRPIESNAPAASDVFDAHTDRAVRALQ